jgi:cytochrome c-type biogenesis protein CcmH/NrfG
MLQAVEISEAEKKPDATLYDHLGDIYAALGEMSKARQAWSNSLKLAPNRDVQRKLEGPEAR